MHYSLINVDEDEHGIITGWWLQDFTGSFNEAVEKAVDINRANGFKLKIVIADPVISTTPVLNKISISGNTTWATIKVQ